MIAIFILFILSLAAIVGVVTYQYVQINRGSIMLGKMDPELENPLSHHNLALYKSSTIGWLEARTRKFVLYALKLSIKVGYFVKIKLDAIVSRVHRQAASHERKLIKEKREDSSESFLTTIGDYKEKIGKKISKKTSTSE
jgi:hypothetical protein